MIFLIAFLVVASTTVYAQDVESVFEAVAQDTEVSPQLDAIDYFALHPLVLRRSTARDLQVLPGFSAATARAVVRMVRADTIHSYEQLAEALALTAEQLQILLLCTTLATPADIAVIYRVRLRGRLAPVRGETTNAFTGSALDLQQRVSVSFSDIRFSIATDKDAGEQSLADFVGGYVQSELGNTQLLVGDYTVQCGMGTVVGRAFGTRKGGDVVSPAVYTRTSAEPQRSATEQNFFRGLACTHRWAVGDSASVFTALWLSSVQRSASIDSTTGAAVSVDTDGYFRTEAEQARRGALGEQAAGIAAEWHSRYLAVGMSALALRYSVPVLSSARSAFSGQSGALLSAHVVFENEHYSAVAEVASDAAGTASLRAGFELRKGSVHCALSFRSFPKTFRSPFGSSFGETVQPNNETGLYIGVSWRAAARMRLSFYADIYRTPGPTSLVPVPVRGLDLYSEYQFQLSRSTGITARIRREDKTDAATVGEQRTLASGRRLSLRGEFQYAISNSLSLRARYEAVYYSLVGTASSETGALCFIEIRHSIDTWLQYSARCALYNTDSFNSALWVYEASPPGAMSAPPYYGGGMRWTALLRYKPSAAITVYLRAGITSKSSVESTGSGLMEVQGQTDSQYTVQVDIAL